MGEGNGASIISVVQAAKFGLIVLSVSISHLHNGKNLETTIIQSCSNLELHFMFSTGN